MSRGRSAAPAAPVLAALALLAPLACASPPPLEARYRPAENLLEVIAVLRRHVPDDTYRFEPARDFSGRNVYRSTLLRLENIEAVHGDALRAGRFDAVIDFAKARALERLRSFDLAAEHYRAAAGRDETLREEALRSAAVCDALQEAAELGGDAAGPEDDRSGQGLSPEEVIERSDRRVRLLEALMDEVRDTHHRYVVEEEIERADVLRARWFTSARRVLEDGNLRALSEWQRVIARHRESRNRNRHLLALADLYAALARDYVEEHPPESLLFDPAGFEELVDSASRLYEAVANQDGTVEKLEAARRLEAFLAFTLRVDRDRFTP